MTVIGVVSEREAGPGARELRQPPQQGAGDEPEGCAPPADLGGSHDPEHRDERHYVGTAGDRREERLHAGRRQTTRRRRESTMTGSLGTRGAASEDATDGADRAARALPHARRNAVGCGGPDLWDSWRLPRPRCLPGWRRSTTRPRGRWRRARRNGSASSVTTLRAPEPDGAARQVPAATNPWRSPRLAVASLAPGFRRARLRGDRLRPARGHAHGGVHGGARRGRDRQAIRS